MTLSYLVLPRCLPQVATHDQQPAAPLPPVRPMTAAERLSRNRQAKRAVTDTTMIDHLSTMCAVRFD